MNTQELIVFYGIKKYIKDEGIPPTIRDICELTDIRSTSTIHKYLNKLKEYGLITYKDGCSRSIKILKEPEYLVKETDSSIR